MESHTFVEAYVSPPSLLDGAARSVLERARDRLLPMLSPASSPQPPPLPLPPARNWVFIGEGPAPELHCPVCLAVLHQAVALKSCGHSFCERCIATWLQGPPAHASCPCCRVAQPLHALPCALSVPNFAARGAVARLRVRCRFAACDAHLALADVAGHEQACEHRDADAAHAPEAVPYTASPTVAPEASPLPPNLATAVAEAEARAEAAHVAADAAMARLRVASEARAAVEARRHRTPLPSQGGGHGASSSPSTFASSALFDLIREARSAARQMAVDAAQHSAALSAAAAAVARASSALDRARADRDAADAAARDAETRAAVAEAAASAARSEAGRMRMSLLTCRADAREREAQLEQRCAATVLARDGQAAALRAALSVLGRVSARSRAEAAADVASEVAAAAPEPPQQPPTAVTTRFPELARVAAAPRRDRHAPESETPAPAEAAPLPAETDAEAQRPEEEQQQQQQQGVGEGRLRRLAHDLHCLDRRLADLSASLTNPRP